MAETNRHGLPRDIPDPIKRQIRQRCGFGCVVCGNAICQYHHVDPAYVDAQNHAPDKIVLLCTGCHGRVNSRLLSNETVRMAANHPKCLENSFSHFSIDMGYERLRIMVGSNTVINVRSFILLGDEKFLQMEPPEQPGAPIQLTATFYDFFGHELASIIRNEWRGNSSNWDVETVGPRITIRRRQGDIALVICASPPDGIIIERLNMFHKGLEFSVRSDGSFFIGGPINTSGNRNSFTFGGNHIENCTAGFILPAVDNPWWTTYPSAIVEQCWSHNYWDGRNPFAFTGLPKAFKRRHHS